MSASSNGAGAGSGAPAAPTGPLMYVRPSNAILEEFLKKRLDEDAPEPTDMEDIRITDFDEAKLRIEIPEEALHTIRVSLKLNNFADLKALGADDYLRGVFGPMLVAPFEDADVTVVVDRRALVAPAADVIAKVSCLRKSVVAFPFHRMLRAVAAGTGGSEKPFVIRTVPEEPIYLLPRVDRVIVIFHLAFSEPTDRAIARVVAQELTEANRQVNNAPPCSWSERDAPLELKGFAGVPRPSADERSIGFMSFSLFPTSLKTDAQREAAASHFALFRTFLAYHIKAAKAYLHARMRQRAEGLQKVLNRAIPEDPFADKGMKLASGKTFVRK